MRERKYGHRKGRGSPAFENHKLSGREGRKEKGGAWRFYNPADLYANPFEPHVRRVARTLALPGKHVRAVEEPAKAAHGKNG